MYRGILQFKFIHGKNVNSSSYNWTIQLKTSYFCPVQSYLRLENPLYSNYLIRNLQMRYTKEECTPTRIRHYNFYQKGTCNRPWKCVHKIWGCQSYHIHSPCVSQSLQHLVIPNITFWYHFLKLRIICCMVEKKLCVAWRPFWEK